jgi:pyridoxal phosphate enzyme (YggS family)
VSAAEPPEENAGGPARSDRGVAAERTIKQVASVRERIAAAARRAGRDPASVTLVAASKTVPVSTLWAGLDAGLDVLGENRAQELVAKAPSLADHQPPPRWHFLGRLQRNKVGALAPWVELWESVDRAELGPVLARRAAGARVLVEVNVAREQQKGGCDPDTAGALVDALRALGLHVAGLMTVPPHGDDPRRWFSDLRDLATALDLTELSMGMSDDFEVTVEESATIVRVGRALFGSR